MARLCLEHVDIESMKLLCDKGASIKTLPMTCVSLAQMEALKYLININADISEMSETHASALFVAVCQEQKEFVEFLIENGADLSQSFNGVSIF